MIEGTAGRPAESWSDDDLFRQVLERGEGDPDRDRAATLLFERYHGKVWTWCRRILADDDLAGEAAQEVFVELLRRPARYAAGGRFGAWLYVSARNRCLNEKKRRARFADEELADAVGDVTAADDPSVNAERRELSERFRDACRRALTHREQEVVYLRYHWGMKVGEITEHLGLENASGARTHLRTAEKKLRVELADIQDGPPGGRHE